MGVMVVAVMFVGVVALDANTASAECSITTTLRVGSSGDQVKCLQTAVGAIPDGSFGPATKAKVATWQATVGLSADGVFGPMSLAKLMGAMTGGSGALCPNGMLLSNNCAAAPVTGGALCPNGMLLANNCAAGAGTPSGPLTGGAGDITISALSTYGDEQVGEDEENVKVLAFEIEADDGSDVDITSVKVELNQQDTSNSEDMSDYMSSVSVWMGSTKVGEAKESDFSEATGHVWSKSIALDNAVIKAGDTEKFYLAVSGLSNLDSGDINDDDWQIGVSSVRFVDAEGVSTTESLTLDIDDNAVDETLEEEFDFASFATAADVELKAALKSGTTAAAINEAHVINAETGAVDTEDVDLLSFTLKATGSDINVAEIPVIFTAIDSAAGALDEATVFTSARLVYGGEVVSTKDVPTGGVVTFDDLDIDISEGDTEDFLVVVDLQDLTGALDPGDQVKAELDGTRVDLIDASDESGEDLAAGDLTGTAMGEYAVAYDSGIMVKLVSVESVVTNDGDAGVATSTQTGSFKVTFDVTAFDDDMRLDDDAAVDTAPFTTVTQLSYSEVGSPATSVPSFASSTGATHDTESFLVEEDTTERFTLTVAMTPTSSGFFSMKLEGLGWTAGSADAVGANIFTFGLDDFKTGDLYLVEYD